MGRNSVLMCTLLAFSLLIFGQDNLTTFKTEARSAFVW